MDRYMNANIIFSKFSRDYIELKKDLPIRPSEMGVLNIITKRDGLFTPVMISELLGVSKPMIAAHISVLEKKGYIYKDSSPSDKRSFYIMPTKKAKELVKEADGWRIEAWDFIRRRPDVIFSLLTKRASRIKECLPSDWGDGWDNVTFAVSTENQKRVDERIPYLLEIPAKHIWISVKPFIGEVDLDKYLATGRIETVLAGGENYLGSRPLHYEWVKRLHDQCEKHNVQLIFGQTGNIFIKDGKEYKIRNRTEQMVQALKSGLHYPPVDIEKEVAAIYARKKAMKEAIEAKRKTKESDKFHC